MQRVCMAGRRKRHPSAARQKYKRAYEPHTEQVVIDAHEHSQAQRSHQCIDVLLPRNRISDGGEWGGRAKKLWAVSRRGMIYGGKSGNVRKLLKPVTFNTELARNAIFGYDETSVGDCM
ncbi:hypothetical protein EVAR_84637_1 [Eumeta japonica]|uniref:Uncharacterized protein n=1 Tax=Eumeta variegata TaxID=151549 RepID=A0A4C1UYI0_EUMVA|nr:hypothetical protein EVAR_84637_1 [Eumeta japonica]